MLPKSSAWPTSPQGPSMHPHQHRGFFPPDFRLTAQTLSVRGSSWDVTFKPRLVCPDRTGPCSTFHQTLKPPGIQNGLQKVWTELGKGSGYTAWQVPKCLLMPKCLSRQHRATSALDVVPARGGGHVRSLVFTAFVW